MPSRYTLAVLTDKGRKVLVEAAPVHVEAVNRLVFDVLTTAQARQLGIIARRILQGLHRDSQVDDRVPAGQELASVARHQVGDWRKRSARLFAGLLTRV